MNFKKNHLFTWKTTKAEAINTYLENEIAKIEKQNGLVFIDTVENETKTFPDTVLEYMEKHIQGLLKKNRIGEYERYKSLKNKLILFLKTKEKSDFEFDEVDLPFLTQFDAFVRSTVKAQATVHGYVKKFGTIYRKAIAEDKYVPKMNPFLYFKNVVGESKKYALSIEQVKHLEANSNYPGNLDIDTFHALNTFLFQIYASGLRVSDTLSLKWKNVSGTQIVTDIRKSKKIATIPLKGSPKTINIIRYYMPGDYKMAYLMDFNDPLMEKTLTPDEATKLNKNIRMNFVVKDDGTFIDHTRIDFYFDDPFRLNHLLEMYAEISMSESNKQHIFPYIYEDTSRMTELAYYDLLGTRTVKYNKHLKKLMPILKTNISLSSHISRHTFANIAKARVGVDQVAQMLVHSSMAQTQTYLDQIEDETMNQEKINIINSF